MKKSIAISVILLFILSTISSMADGSVVLFDDTTPPVTTCTLDPPYPNGLNGWYVSDVTVSLNATDDMSGVKEIRYHVNGIPGTIPGDHGAFLLTEDGDDIIVEYWAIDNAGNTEPKHTFYIDIDQTKPDIDLRWDAFKESCSWYVKFTINATDATSGIHRIKIYINEGFYKEIIGPGPEYEFIIKWSNDYKYVVWKFEAHDIAGNTDNDTLCSYGWVPPSFPHIFGIICNLEISEENVTFFALIVLSNYGGIHTFKRFTFPNDYEGYIDRFFIDAKFCDWYDWPPI